MPRRESLYHRYPDYEVVLEPSSEHLRVRLHGQVLADSRRTLRVLETKHAAVVYFPRADVRFDLLEASDHETFCPFKGEASYWTARLGERTEENLVWGYDTPFEQVAGLVDYVAFYEDRVEWEKVS